MLILGVVGLVFPVLMLLMLAAFIYFAITDKTRQAGLFDRNDLDAESDRRLIYGSIVIMVFVISNITFIAYYLFGG